MLYFKEASHTAKYNKWLVYADTSFDAILLGELSKQFETEDFSFSTNKYLFSHELEQIVIKLKELNAGL